MNLSIITYSRVTTQEESVEKSDLVLNSSFYKTSPDMQTQMKRYSEVQEEYRDNTSRCRSLDCMSQQLALYDLSWDITESYNLSWRWVAETQQLYSLLRQYSNSTHYPVQPLYFEDINSEAKTEDNVWTPWLSNDSVV